MGNTLRFLGSSILGVLLFTGSSVAQTVTNQNPITSNSNPVSNLDQSGALINTQINTHQLGRSIVGNGIADCTTSGISASTFGSAVGPFDSGTFGGAVTYTHSFGMKTCKKYAKTQLGKLQLETCLLLISNYSKMRKAGIEVDYQQLMEVSDIQCPAIQLAGFTQSSQPVSPAASTDSSAQSSNSQAKASETESFENAPLDSKASDLLAPQPSQNQTTQTTSPRENSSQRNVYPIPDYTKQIGR